MESVASVECDSNSSDDDCQDDVHTRKPFSKGMNLFRSGHVKNIHDVSCKGHYFVKASSWLPTHNIPTTVQ